MKTVAWSVLCLLSSQTAFALDGFTDQGRVLSVTPQIERVYQPRQDCRTIEIRERVYGGQPRSNTGAVVGGVAGGLLGSTIGRGSGRVAAAAVGAGIGALVGDRVDNQAPFARERVVTRPVEECVTVDDWRSVTTGYVVQYEYLGRQYTTVMDRDPGQSIDLNVTVSPRQAANPTSYYPANYRSSHRGQGRYRDHW